MYCYRGTVDHVILNVLFSILSLFAFLLVLMVGGLLQVSQCELMTVCIHNKPVAAVGTPRQCIIMLSMTVF